MPYVFDLSSKEKESASQQLLEMQEAKLKDIQASDVYSEDDITDFLLRTKLLSEKVFAECKSAAAVMARGRKIYPIEQINKLGEYGWVIPLFFESDQLVSFLSSPCVDECIARKLLENNSAFFHEMVDEIREVMNSDIAKKRIREAQKAFESNLYSCCVFTLAPIIEGLLARLDISKIGIEKRYNKLHDTWEKYPLAGNRSLLLIFPLQQFIHNFVKKSNFDDEEPEHINRHWLCHGRSNKKFEKKHCLQLFCAIYALAGLISAYSEEKA